MPNTMENISVENAEVIVPEETTVTVIEEPKKKRKPRQKTRPVEELFEAKISGMSDKEKTILIDTLKEMCNEAASKLEMLEQNIISTREQQQNLKREYDQMEAFYRKKLQYVKVQLKAFSEAIDASILGGEK